MLWEWSYLLCASFVKSIKIPFKNVMNPASNPGTLWPIPVIPTYAMPLETPTTAIGIPINRKAIPDQTILFLLFLKNEKTI